MVVGGDMNACAGDVVGQFLVMLILSLAVATVSVTVTLSKIFEKPRDWIAKRSEFLGGLTSCPYCFSHWGSFLAVLIFAPKVVSVGPWAINFIVTSFAMVAMAAWSARFIIRTYGKQYQK